MSTITKQAVQAVADLKAGYTLGHADVAILNELARIALASLEAEPVGEVSEQRDGLVMDGTVDLGGASTHRIIKGASKMKRLPLGTKFYTAPPAPVYVPAAMEMDDDFDSAFEHGKAVGWNAYRAAMLQGADGALTNEDTKQVGELVMWVKRLAHSLRKTNPDSKLQSDAMDYLSRKGLVGVEDILR